MVAGSRVSMDVRPLGWRICGWLLALLGVVLAIASPLSIAQSVGTVIRVKAGGGAYTDSLGHLWSADSGYYNVGNSFQVSSAIAGTSDPALFQSGRYDDISAPDMQYAVTVPNGWYQVSIRTSTSSPRQVSTRR